MNKRLATPEMHNAITIARNIIAANTMNKQLSTLEIFTIFGIPKTDAIETLKQIATPTNKAEKAMISLGITPPSKLLPPPEKHGG